VVSARIQHRLSEGGGGFVRAVSSRKLLCSRYIGGIFRADLPVSGRAGQPSTPATRVRARRPGNAWKPGPDPSRRHGVATGRTGDNAHAPVDAADYDHHQGAYGPLSAGRQSHSPELAGAGRVEGALREPTGRGAATSVIRMSTFVQEQERAEKAADETGTGVYGHVAIPSSAVRERARTRA
jgi:hypothetical protein